MESDTNLITCGVPQGSVLGPLLFIIYTNDLPNNIKHAKTILFADDTTVYYNSDCIHNLYETMNNELKILSDWFKANKLSLNANKTNYLIFSKKSKIQPDLNLSIDNAKLAKSHTVKFLGLLIDDKLEWPDQIEHIRKKMASGVYALNATKNFLSKANLKLIYYSLIHPYLTYGILLWGNAYKKHTNKLLVMQKKAIRSITKSKYNDHAAPLFKELKIPNIHDIYKIQLGKFIFCSLSNKLPIPLCNMHIQNNEIHQYNTRTSNNMHLPPFRSELVHQSFIYQAPFLWANIPDTIKLSANVKCFCSRLLKFQIAEYT
jgi:hypothetical protein